MPTAAHFRRNHFDVPRHRPAEVTVEGVRTVMFRVDRRRDSALSRVSAVLECAGHRRSEIEPPVPGVQWDVGAVSEADWGGWKLGELLREAGIPPSSRTVVFHGRDQGLRPDADLAVQFARAISLEKALAAETLVAWEMNGEAIPPVHGGPLRAIVPGHYAVDSVKWLERVTFLEGAFRGPFQLLDYRVFSEDDDKGMELHELPVHSLLLCPSPGRALAAGRHELSGIAWGGLDGVSSVEVRIGDGPWRRAQLQRSSTWGRVFWSLDWKAIAGAYTVAVRATDAAGGTQPDAPRWNRLGYANNSIQRVVIEVT
jgi:DMSO/TMAO reductase YedYZ molybdopterin-dependent catalytic subunit